MGGRTATDDKKGDAVEPAHRDFKTSYPYSVENNVATLAVVAKNGKVKAAVSIAAAEDGSATMEMVPTKGSFKNGTSRLADLPMKKVADSSPLCEAKPSE
ncbi:MAG: hypothetical protein VB934_19510 [Polyangiaceae bacterium]